MPNVWVYKFDGRIQCEPESQPVSLETMRDQLAALIGSPNILSMRKASRPMPDRCGSPTGSMNTYEITSAGWRLLERGTVGKNGFEKLDKSPA